MHRQIAGKLTGRVTKWFVLAFWVLAVMGLGGFAGKLTEVQNNEASSWLPGNAESTRALEKMKPFQDPNAIPTTVVYEKKSGFTAEDLAALKQQAAALQQMDDVTGKVVGPIPSQDGQAAQTVVTYGLGANGWNKMPAIADKIHGIASVDGGTVYIAGAGGQAVDSAEAFAGLDSTLLFAALGVVILLLLLTYRSPVLWMLPIFSVVVSLSCSLGLIYFLAKYADLTVNGQSQAIVSILVIGAGTDYALLLVARYREELRRHEDRHEAMAFALHRTGPAIFASGATVIAGMLCLLVATMNSTKGLGPVAAVGIAVGLMVMLTLLPALLVIFGRWFFWPVHPSFGSEDHTATGFWARVGKRIARAPRATWVTTSVLLAIGALGIFQRNAVGLENKDSFYGTPDSVVGEQVLATHFPAGSGQPVVVIAKADRADAVKTAMAGVSGISDVAEPVVKGDLAYLAGTLSVAPDSQAAIDAVGLVRDAVHQVEGADAIAGGDSATRGDVLRASSDDNKVIIPLILLVVLVILMLLLRAVVAPVLLIGTVVLSFGAALGISALIFRHVLDFAGADSSLPLFVFVFLVALGIDYNIFLMTRVHEESKQFGTKRGALIGLAATGGVITSAGLVLAGTFAVLATLPVVAFAEIGFAVALGVLLDTLIVRSVLVTALNLDVGRHMWWPSDLAKHVDPEDVSSQRAEGRQGAMSGAEKRDRNI